MPAKRNPAPESVSATSGTRPARTARHRKPAPPVSKVEESPVIATPDPDAMREDIARLAYSFWEERGYQGGSPEDDWLRAEAELMARLTLTAKA